MPLTADTKLRRCIFRPYRKGMGPTCEGTGQVIDFRAIRTQPELVPIFLNRDPRGYALKINDGYVRTNRLDVPTDWGGYGLIAPDLREGN